MTGNHRKGTHGATTRIQGQKVPQRSILSLDSGGCSQQRSAIEADSLRPSWQDWWPFVAIIIQGPPALQFKDCLSFIQMWSGHMEGTGGNLPTVGWWELLNICILTYRANNSWEERPGCEIQQLDPLNTKSGSWKLLILLGYSLKILRHLSSQYIMGTWVRHPLGHHFIVAHP